MIDGNVSAGPGCNLSGTNVVGNVTVNPGGSLVTELGMVATDNVTSDQGTELALFGGGLTGGNLQLRGTEHITLLPGARRRAAPPRPHPRRRQA